MDGYACMQKIFVPGDLARELKVDKNHLIISVVDAGLKKDICH